MKKLPKISESEWLVMRVLWSKSPLAAQEVFEQLDTTTKWKPKTVKTLIDRLVKKAKQIGINYSRILEDMASISAETNSMKLENWTIKKLFIEFSSK